MCIYQYSVKSTKADDCRKEAQEEQGHGVVATQKVPIFQPIPTSPKSPILADAPHSYFVASSPTAKQVALPPVASSPAATAATPALAKPVPAAKMDGAPWRWLGSLRRAAAARPISRLSRCLPAWPQPRVTHLSGLRGGMNFSLKCLLRACFLESLCNSNSKFGPKQSSILQKKKKRGNFGL